MRLLHNAWLSYDLQFAIHTRPTQPKHPVLAFESCSAHLSQPLHERTWVHWHPGPFPLVVWMKARNRAGRQLTGRRTASVAPFLNAHRVNAQAGCKRCFEFAKPGCGGSRPDGGQSAVWRGVAEHWGFATARQTDFSWFDGSPTVIDCGCFR